MTKKHSLNWHLKKKLTKKRLYWLFNTVVISLSIYFLGHALNIVMDNELLRSIWGEPITVRKFNVGAYFESYEGPFYVNVVFYFETKETFCAYNPIHVRAVLFGNRLNETAVAGIILQGSRFYPDRLDVYGLIPQTGLIELHEPTDPTLVDLASQYPEALVLEGKTTVQWNLEGDYRWGIVNATKDVMVREEEYKEEQYRPIIHISPVDSLIQIGNNQRMEALTFSVFGLSILAVQPIIKSIAFEDIETRKSKSLNCIEKNKLVWSLAKLPLLYLKCKTCGVTFSSGIAMGEESFRSTILKRNRHTCPKRHEHEYNKEDYFFKRTS